MNKTINLIIATYAGQYNNENKKNILKLNLKIVNELNPNIDKITIMKPKINVNHVEILDYYNFNELDLNNISNKIEIIECENIGISYGQYFTGIFNNTKYDYYILIEDDYVIFKNNFADNFIEEYLKHENDCLLCSFIYKKKYWDIMNYAQNINESLININLLENKLIKFNLNNIKCNIPDFSLILLSNKTVNKFIDRFTDLNTILEIFNINFEKIWLHQILFGYIIYASSINIYDIVTTHLNIFYNTGNNSISLCNFEDYVGNWKDKKYKDEKFKSPLFIPIQLLNNNQFIGDLNIIKIYLTNQNDFFDKYNEINLLVNNIDDNLIIRNLEKYDYKNYLNLMFEFTNYKYNITIENFNNEINEIENKGLKEIIILEKDNNIIGAGTIFKLVKLHNNPIGQIEDVIITKNYRKLGFKKIIINKLVDIGLNKMNCYKIILNCLNKNINFYKNCGFDEVGIVIKKQKEN